VTGRERDRDREFVRDVLARTSGSACDRACGLLPDLADGALAVLDRQLVQRHLEHCPGCRAVALALGRLGPELAARAELDPGPEFLAGVVARTSGRSAAAQRRRAREAAASGPGGLVDRLGRWWLDRVLRPRFALQAAYAAALVLALLTATPVSPLKGASERAVTAVTAMPAALPGAGEAAAWLDERAGAAAGGLREELDHRAADAAEAMGRRTGRTADERERCVRHLGAAWSHLRGGRFGAASGDLLEALQAGGAAWRQFWSTHPDHAG
jgi:hypothetical protein